MEIPCVIGGREVRTGRILEQHVPHAHRRVLARAHQAGPREMQGAIKAAREAWQTWSRTPWEARAAIFLKAADLLAGPRRDTLNAATMLGQSKTAHQAEIDSACELIDFLRFNAHFAETIYADQPISSPGTWNQMEYRAARGVRARGHAVQLHLDRRQPADRAGDDGEHRALEAGVDGGRSRHWSSEGARGGRPAARRDQLHPRPRLARRADGDRQPRPRRRPLHRLDRGLPARSGDGRRATSAATATTRAWSARPAARTSSSPTPRPTPMAVAIALVRGAFEYQGQKCSAACRAYVPQSLWPKLRERAGRAAARGQAWATSPTSPTSWAR